MAWAWSVWGKHPAFKDYFHLGAADPLGRGMAEWMRQGYAQVQINRGRRHFFSWRFWMKSWPKDSLACGLLRDSSDYLGRPYPILFMGTGLLPNWEKNWDLLPLALEHSWNQMESLLIKSYPSLKDFQEEVLRIPPPGEEWEKMNQRRREKGNKVNIEERAQKILNQDIFFVPLDEPWALEPIILASYYQYFWKKQGEGIPNSIFLGGSLEKTFLAFFRRPLLPEDFPNLWSDAILARKRGEA